jgi:UDP-glucose 4-epimerase
MIAVIGASGFIGSTVAETLSSRGKQILAVDLVKPKGDYNFMIADIADASTLERIFFEYAVETVFHLVGLPEIGICEKDPHLSYVLNTQSVHNALEAMRKTGVKKIIFASSAAVYKSQDTPVSEKEQPAPKTIYGYHKLVSEKLIEAYSNSYGVNFSTLRLFNVFGQDPQLGKDVISIFLRRARNREPLVVTGKNKYRDFIHVKDVADAFVACMSSDTNNKTINVGAGVRTTLGQLVDLIKEAFPKSKVEYKNASDDGEGLVADNHLYRKLLNLTPTDPHEALREHIRRYSK